MDAQSAEAEDRRCPRWRCTIAGNMNGGNPARTLFGSGADREVSGHSLFSNGASEAARRHVLAAVLRVFSAALTAVCVTSVALVASASAARAASPPSPTWTRALAGVPTFRTDASMAYDPGTDQLVLFGGQQGIGSFSTTWTLNGTIWSKLMSKTSPPGLAASSMAYDSATGQLVLFGGIRQTVVFSTTWDWSGTTWTKLSPMVSPPARAGASMAYDPATHQLVLFGGGRPPLFTTTFGSSTTWDWSGSTWTKLSPMVSPPALTGAPLAYDPATRQLVLFDGPTTWTWSGTTWTKLSPKASPPARTEASMAYDPATRQLVLFGGASGTHVFATTWTWNGTTWTKLSPMVSPPALTGAPLAYDPATRQLVLFDGPTTWYWNGTIWKLLPETSPSARHTASMSYDAASHQLVLFGGENTVTAGAGSMPLTVYIRFVTTWDWNGTTWTKLSPKTSPPALTGASMAYDPATRRLVLFGGSATWSWNGTTWAKIHTQTSPPALSGAALADDTVTHQLVMFDGATTWDWNGTTWTKLSPKTSPPALAGASMAYDPATLQLVLVGAASGAHVFTTTWTWNGGTWTKRTPVTSAPALKGASLAYDPATRRLVLFGGSATWGWNGTTWAMIHTQTSPPARDGASLAYDAATAQLVLFGGSRYEATSLATTWLLATPPRLGVLSPPSGVKATAGDGWVGLSWSTDPGATSYEVFDATRPGHENYRSAAACRTEATTCTVRGLKNNAQYVFTVKASKGKTVSGPSKEVRATPQFHSPFPLVDVCPTPPTYEPSQLHWCTSGCSSFVTGIIWHAWGPRSAAGAGTYVTATVIARPGQSPIATATGHAIVSCATATSVHHPHTRTVLSDPKYLTICPEGGRPRRVLLYTVVSFHIKTRVVRAAIPAVTGCSGA